MKIADLLRALDAKFPFARVEKWDRVGLLIGDRNAPAKRVLVAHEVTEEILDAARGYDTIVTYHPLIFRAMENLDCADPTARLVSRCVRENLSVIAAHTALDHAPSPHALGDQLAQSLGLQAVQVLAASGSENLWKIVVFVPETALEDACEALWSAGAGEIGRYSRASFRSSGIGTFRPETGAQPHVGTMGQDSAEPEWRLEVIATGRVRDDVVRAVTILNFYEEIAHDIYPLYNTIEPYGSCRVGTIAAQSLDEWARIVAEKLQPPNVRLVRAPSQSKILRVACVPGAGASFLDKIARAGVDCLVTGDFKHHDALKARALGVSVVDVTHTPTERAAVAMLADVVRNAGAETVDACEIDTNPFENL